MADRERIDEIVHILNTHFPTNWSNENLRERVIEFGEDVHKAGMRCAAQIALERAKLEHYASAAKPFEEIAATIEGEMKK